MLPPDLSPGPIDSLRQELLAAFEAEHKEHLQAIRAGLEGLERRQAADLRDIFRRAHSLKGAARAVDLPVVEEVAHRLEAVLALVGEGRLALAGRVAAGVQLGLDGIEGYVAGLAGGDPPLPLAALAGLAALLDPPGGAPTGAGAPGRLPAAVLPAAGLPMAGASVAGGVPPATPLPAAPPSQVAGEALAAPPDLAPPQGEAPEATPAGASLRVPAEQVEALAAAVQALAEAALGPGILGPGTLEPGSLEPGLDDTIGTPAGLRALGGELAGLRRLCEALLQGAADPRLRQMQRGLDQLSRSVARMTREQRAAEAATEAAALHLRAQVEAIALVPAETVLGPLGHMARTLAREAAAPADDAHETDAHAAAGGPGQAAAVRLEGLALRADRHLLQALKDPALHLLRNAIGHGLESPAARLAAGKPARAEVVLRLASHAGLLLLTVRDDGPGPDLARIEATAIRQGLLPARAPGAPPPPAGQLLALVFAPGFSTAAAVDRLSGRGMGLSVVAEAARRLRGGALMRALPGGGTEVEIAVPASATRQTLLLVEAGGQSYGLPGHGVERLLRLPLAGLESSAGRSVARIEVAGRDVVVPMIALATLLGTPGPLPVAAGHVNAVLLHHGGQRCAVAVEALRDVRGLRVEAFEAPGLEPGLVAGIAPRGSDTPLLVLSPGGLVARWRRDAAGALPPAPTPASLPAAGLPRARRTILVVDDSITTRTLEKSILEAQGYRVLLSVDGLDALALLRGGEAVVDLVVADVEMPRMDGFALLQALRNDPRLSPIPVILMTSRAGTEDVRRGLDLGARAYIAKQKFDQRELLATIGQLL